MFLGSSDHELYKKIISGRFNIPDYISHYAKDLLHLILTTNPERRPLASELLLHPWVKGENSVLNSPIIMTAREPPVEKFRQRLKMRTLSEIPIGILDSLNFDEDTLFCIVFSIIFHNKRNAWDIKEKKL